ncbi:MAG: 4Fe-4S binding protein [Oscillospiraceae bacterium]|nr:4Fe-4S binding protein [Oscillospiraceae bacterium]
MIRRIIEIDESKCIGCGACAKACHEGAIGMVDGKAKLLRDDYCDGLGDCLPTCPTGAIKFVEREALAYDEDAVKAAMAERKACSCPGSVAQSIERKATNVEPIARNSQLRQWPVQIKLVSVEAPFFNGSKLLIAADCTAYSYANFHQEFMKDHIPLIGCPKLDGVDYSEKLTEILKLNDVRSITVTRMELPCCGGIENAVKKALQNCGKLIPWSIVTISKTGEIVDRT